MAFEPEIVLIVKFMTAQKVEVKKEVTIPNEKAASCAFWPPKGGQTMLPK